LLLIGELALNRIDAPSTHSLNRVAAIARKPCSHRDFVTHAWADDPIEDILLRIDDPDLRIETAGVMGPNSAGAFTSRRN
jgi:hypothetical protein